MDAFVIRPATPERWPHVVEVFGPHGGDGGCWCWWWRATGSEFAAGVGTPNRERLHDLVVSGAEPGLLAYEAVPGDDPSADERPVGWVAIAPRSEFGRLLRSPRFRPTDASDDTTTWSLNCFVVPRSERGRGVARALLDGAVRYAREHGASVVEAYPVDTATAHVRDADLYTGSLAWFLDAGFAEVDRRREARPIVRRHVR